MKHGMFLLLAGLLLLPGCSQDRKIVFDGFAQGTTYHIAYYTSGAVAVSQQEIDSVLSAFDKSCSVYDTTSLIVAINENRTDSLDANILGCLEIARKMHAISDGLYDITVLPLTKAYGFARKQDQSVDNINLDSILQFVGMEKFSVENGRIIKHHPNLSFDLNSVAQGYSVDLVSDYLKQKGITDFIVEIGGEIYCSGDNKGQLWGVGIDRPTDNNLVPGEDIQAILRVKDRGLTTSGNYRKFYEKGGKRINHTINPKTGESISNEMLSVTVVAENAAIADGYTTTFMTMGKEKTIAYLAQHPELEALIVYHEGDTIKTFVTENLKNKITLK